MADSKPVISRIINAPRAKVWQAWTEPDQIKKWWGPENFSAPQAEVDLKVGGKYLYCMRGALGPGMPEQDMWSGGIFQEIVPEQKIVVLDSFADKDGNIIEPSHYGMEGMPAQTEITITFEDEAEGKTKLTITYGAAVPEQYLPNMMSGWNSSIDKLVKSLGA